MNRCRLPLLLACAMLTLIAWCAKAPGKPAPPKPNAPINAAPAKPAPTPAPAAAPPVVVADSALPDYPGYGIHGEYFADDHHAALALTRIDPSFNVNWGNSAPAPGVPGDYFSVRWKGRLWPRYTETYTFRLTADDAARVWVDGKLVASTWGDVARQEKGTLELAGDKLVPIVVEYREGVGGAAMTLFWSSPTQKEEPVPTERLYPADVRLGKLIYADAAQGPKGNLYVITATEPARLLATRAGGACEPAMAAGGGLLAFTACWHSSWNDPKTVKNTELYTMNPDGTDLRRATTNFYADAQPAVSRDGRRLAFVANPTGTNGDLFMMPVGGRPRAVTADAGNDTAPVFTPDGKQLLFQSDRNGRWDLFAVALDTGEETLLVEDAWSPAVSPNGKTLLFLSARDGQTDLYQMVLETKTVTRLTKTPEAESNPLYSPDGAEIAYLAPHDANKRDIYLTYGDGKCTRRITKCGNVAAFTWGW